MNADKTDSVCWTNTNSLPTTRCHFCLKSHCAIDLPLSYYRVGRVIIRIRRIGIDFSDKIPERQKLERYVEIGAVGTGNATTYHSRP